MKKFLVILAVAAMTLMSVSAYAAYDMKIDDDTFAKFSIGLQYHFKAENPGTDKFIATAADDQLVFSGQITNLVKFGASYGFSQTGAKFKDVLIMFDFAKEFKINVGQYRMAVSRVALQNTYSQMIFETPEVAAAGYLTGPTTALAPASYRGAGVTVWGDFGPLRYNVGAWDGANAPVNAFGAASNEIGLSGRVVFNFMDPEKGYTCTECYLGKAQIFNIGAGYYQIENTAKTQKYTVKTVDVLYDANNLTLEGGYFIYDLDNALGEKPTGYYAEAGFLIDKIQPVARYESFDADVAANDNGDYQTIVVGVNYLIAGQDAKVGLHYKMKDFDGTGTDIDTTVLAFQVQF